MKCNMLKIHEYLYVYIFLSYHMSILPFCTFIFPKIKICLG